MQCLDTLTTLGVMGEGESLQRWRNYKMGYPLLLGLFVCFFPDDATLFSAVYKVNVMPHTFPHSPV